MSEDELIDIDGYMDEEEAPYCSGWCPRCGDPESACLCDAYPSDEMDEWHDDDGEED